MSGARTGRVAVNISSDAAVLAPGLRTVATPGHTQGHVAIEIVSGTDALLVLGDAVTHPVICTPIGGQRRLTCPSRPPPRENHCLIGLRSI